MPKVLFQVID